MPSRGRNQGRLLHFAAETAGGEQGPRATEPAWPIRNLLHRSSLSGKASRWAESDTSLRSERAQESGVGALAGPARNLIRASLDPLTKRAEAYVRKQQASRGRTGVAAEWIEAVGPDMAAWVALQVVLRGFPEERDAQDVAREIASHLQTIRHASRGQRDICGGSKAATRRRIREQAGELGDLEFKPGQALKIGGTLVTLLLNAGTLVQLDELGEGKEGWRGRKVVFTDSARVEMYRRGVALGDRYPQYPPMLVAPSPWSRDSHGGYVGALRGRLPLIKKRPDACLDSVDSMLFESLNRIQETPWQINRAVLRLAKEVWKSGTHRLARPRFSLAVDRSAGTYGERSRLAKVGRFRATLDVAYQLRGAEQFYFPHHLDFRGRVYPVPQALNPQGDDLARALLRFARGKALGDEGAFWLALHGANCLGETPEGRNLSQETLEQRVICIEKLTKEIEVAATTPLESPLIDAAATHGDPWQFYAFAAEWAEYMREAADGRGAEFVSHLPCGQDGSCNGLQHMAALWRDTELARRVNLLESKKPNDFYTDMLGSVQTRLRREASGDVELPASWTCEGDFGRKRTRSEQASATEREAEVQRRKELAATWLDSGLLTRRLMKTPAMTFSYGASRWRFLETTAEHIRGETPDPFSRSLSSQQREDPDDVFEPISSAPARGSTGNQAHKPDPPHAAPVETAPEPLTARDMEERRILDLACDQFAEESLQKLWSDEGRAFNYLAGVMYDVMEGEAGDYRRWFRSVARQVVGRGRATPEEIKQWTPSAELENPGRAGSVDGACDWATRGAGCARVLGAAGQTGQACEDRRAGGRDHLPGAAAHDDRARGPSRRTPLRQT